MGTAIAISLETITTAFVESAVNHLVRKRMVKQQQIHWTEPGANLLLQVRAKVLNGELRQTFYRWYPRMKEGTEQPFGWWPDPTDS